MLKKADEDVFLDSLAFVHILAQSNAIEAAMNASLTLHTLAPLVENHYKLAEMSWLLLRSDEQSKQFTTIPTTFAVLYSPPSFHNFTGSSSAPKGIPKSKAQQFLTPANSRVFTTIETLFDALDAVFRNSQFSISRSFNINGETETIPVVLPHDHIFPSASTYTNEKPVVILYSSLDHPSLEEWLSPLKLAQEDPTTFTTGNTETPDGSPPFDLTFRHNRLMTERQSPRPNLLAQGFSVELSVRDSEYKFTDTMATADAGTKSKGKKSGQYLTTDGEEELEEDPDQDGNADELENCVYVGPDKWTRFWPIFGIDILQVASFFPHLAGLRPLGRGKTQAELTPEFVLEVDTPLGALYSRLKQLALKRNLLISQVKDLGLQTATIIMNNQRPLELLKTATEVFPYFAHSAIRINVTTGMRNAIIEMHNHFSPMHSSTLINNRAIDLTSSLWNVMSIAEDEVNHARQINSLGLQSTTTLQIAQTSLNPPVSYERNNEFSFVNPACSSTLAFSLQTTRVMYRLPEPLLYLNNIETDKQFQSWSGDCDIFKEYPPNDPYPLIRRNFAVLIAFLDLTKPECLEVYQMYLGFLENRVPVRMAIVPVNTPGTTSKSSAANKIARWFVWHCQHYDAATAVNILNQLTTKNPKLSVDRLKEFVTSMSLNMDRPPNDKKRKLVSGVPMMSLDEWKKVVEGRLLSVEDALDAITNSLAETQIPVPSMFFNGIVFNLGMLSDNVNELFSQEMNFYRWSIREGYLRIPPIKQLKHLPEAKRTNAPVEYLWKMLSGEKWMEKAYQLGVTTRKYAPEMQPLIQPNETESESNGNNGTNTTSTIPICPCESSFLNVSTNRLSYRREEHKYHLDFLSGCENHATVVQKSFHPLLFISHDLPTNLFIPPTSSSAEPLTAQIKSSPLNAAWKCHFAPETLTVRAMNAAPVVSYPTERTSTVTTFRPFRMVQHMRSDDEEAELNVGENVLENHIPLTHLIVIDPENATHLNMLNTIVKSMTPGLSQLHILMHTVHHYSNRVGKTDEDRVLFPTTPLPSSFAVVYLSTISTIPFNLRAPYLRLLLDSYAPPPLRKKQSNVTVDNATIALEKSQKIHASIVSWIDENKANGRNRRNEQVNEKWAETAMNAIDGLFYYEDVRASVIAALKEHCLLIDSLGLSCAVERALTVSSVNSFRILDAHLQSFFIITNGIVRPILSTDDYTKHLSMASVNSIVTATQPHSSSSLPFIPTLSRPVGQFVFTADAFNALETFELQQRSIHVWRPLFANIDAVVSPKAILLYQLSEDPDRPIAPNIMTNPSTDSSQLVSILNLMQTRHCYVAPRASAMHRDQFTSSENTFFKFDVMKGAYNLEDLDEEEDDDDPDNEFSQPTLLEVKTAVNPMNGDHRPAIQNLFTLRSYYRPFMTGTVWLVPSICPSQMPLRSLYLSSTLRSPRFFQNGSMISSPKLVFPGVPHSSFVWTMNHKAPSSWLCIQKEAVDDLDNIQFGRDVKMIKNVDGEEEDDDDDDGMLPPTFEIDQQKRVKAVYAIDAFLLQGSMRDVQNFPMSGAPVFLTTFNPVKNESTGELMFSPRKDSSIVMEMNGYYQLHMPGPGIHEVTLHPALSKQLHFTEISPHALGKTDRKSRLDKPAGNVANGEAFLPKSRRGFWVDMNGWDGMELNIRTNYIQRQGTVYPQVAAAIRKEEEKKAETAAKGKKPKKPTVPKVATKPSMTTDTIHIFTICSGHLYERLAKIMMVSVVNTAKRPVKFWFINSATSPRFRAVLPKMAAEMGFSFEFMDYGWPQWLGEPTSRMRKIWAYKILFLDVMFPMELERVIFVDADQMTMTDFGELMDLDMKGAPYAYTPMCNNKPEMKPYRFWESEYWRTVLKGKPYHISALYAVDLIRFREMGAGDHLRKTYDTFSNDKNSLSNLDQDLPNYCQDQIPIYSLPQEWLWCGSWCSDETRSKAKTLDLCNNPLTKEHKLKYAEREMPEWNKLHAQVLQMEERMEGLKAFDTFRGIGGDEKKKKRNVRPEDGSKDEL
ncbi:putative UDP-glucose:glycoprotein glucosyltransferase [Blattamonas nauphoetae]|uniref:UDP-glucose:glycoprotein glucosyltransferase n=1 Tax=Blattamonas nauphoetae TaxID=2049346 RepID=A0ABQ9X3N4_9EUKA|nr:putative UDP-glucose:glycoprotein glucosyltransferase [Blattamonas nauphoetae]